MHCFTFSLATTPELDWDCDLWRFCLSFCIMTNLGSLTLLIAFNLVSMFTLFWRRHRINYGGMHRGNDISWSNITVLFCPSRCVHELQTWWKKLGRKPTYYCACIMHKSAFGSCDHLLATSSWHGLRPQAISELDIMRQPFGQRIKYW